MISLTKQQDALLRFLEEKIKATRVAPSLEEMRVHMGFASKSGIHRILVALEDRGYIKRRRDYARAIELLGEK